MTLPADIARCRGFGPTPDDWLEECRFLSLPFHALPLPAGEVE